jgi:RNA polymerase sigma factor (sigma-70 family)
VFPVPNFDAVNGTDNALMAQVSNGEVAKMAVLFERHHRPLFRYFVSMNRNREIAEDLVQDVFFRMLRYRASYDPTQSFTAWMYQIARNASVDQAQKRKAEVVGIDEFEDRRLEPVSDAPGPEETASTNQNVALLRVALDRLPQDKREVLVLSRFQNMKYDQIAEILGCEVGTVKVRVFRAMKALEQAYAVVVEERRLDRKRDATNGN